MISISGETGSGRNYIQSADYNSRALMNGSTLLYTKMNITIRGNETSHDYHWTVLLLLPVVVFGVAGNVLVCMAVSMEKRLQSVTNYFLLSLAITDLLVCLIVWPFSMLNEFVGKPFEYNFVQVCYVSKTTLSNVPSNKMQCVCL